MSGRSQRHLREFHGEDSAGDTSFPGSGADAGSIAINASGGTTTVPAVIDLAGVFLTSETVRANITTSEDVAANFDYACTGGKTDDQAAEGLRAVIHAHANMTATRAGSTIYVLAAVAASTVTVNSVAVV